MGSWAAFYVHKTSTNAIASCCQAWLQANRSWLQRLVAKPPTISQPLHHEGLLEWGILNVSSSPTGVLIYGSEPWVTVKYDRFYQPNELARFVSRTLQTRVVDTLAQTTSDAYLVEVFDAGTTRRRLEFAADAGWIVQHGEPIVGEPDPLESPDEDAPDDPDLARFDDKAVSLYMRTTFGIEWWSPPASGSSVTFVGR